MSAGIPELDKVPLFDGLKGDELASLAHAFERLTLESGHILFSEGEPARYLYVLLDGKVSLKEEGADRPADRQIIVRPVTPIGETGAMTALTRRVTAATLEPSVVLRATREQLTSFFAEHPQIAVTFYQNLLSMVADKIRRDERRAGDMRHNLISTQKSLKKLRDLILDFPTTELSEPTHDILEALITQNRRANYVVEPPQVLPASVRLPDGQMFPVMQMSRKFVDVPPAAAALNGDWSAVLVLPTTEIPIGGSVDRSRDTAVRVTLDLLIDEYAGRLESYLTRAQLLDILL